MPAPLHSKKHKLTVSLPEETSSAIERLAAAKGLTLSEVVRRALALEIFVEDDLDKGSTFLLRHADGELEKLRLIFG